MTIEERYNWLIQMRDLKKNICGLKQQFMSHYPSDMRDKGAMENSFADMVSAVNKFEAGIFEGTYTEHRARE